MAPIEIHRHDFGDLTKLLARIDREILKPQRERRGLKMKLSLLDKFREGQKPRAWLGREKIGVAFGKALEFKKVPLQIGT